MGRDERSWLERVAVVALALFVFAGCDDDSTGPGGDLDPAEAAVTMDQVVTRFIDGNEAVQSLNVFTGLILGAVGPDVVPVGTLPTPGEGLSGWADGLRMSVGTLYEDGGIASIPVGLTGKTLTYNPSTGQYEIDDTRTDAPANGVRFILYAVDPILQQPIQPLQEIGYIDVIDNSSFPTASIEMAAVIGTDTLIAMDVTGTFSQTTADLAYTGFLSDGEGRLDFQIQANGTQESVSLDFTASFGEYTVGFNFSGVVDGDSGSFMATFSDADDTIEFNLSAQGGVIGTGSGVSINGEPVAIISGTLENPTVTNGDLEPLSEQELAALQELFEGMGDVIEMFFELFIFGTLLLSLSA